MLDFYLGLPHVQGLFEYVCVWWNLEVGAGTHAVIVAASFCGRQQILAL